MPKNEIHDLDSDPLSELFKQASIAGPASQEAAELYRDYQRWSETFSEK